MQPTAEVYDHIFAEDIARRAHNCESAVRLAMAGFYVFPAEVLPPKSNGKRDKKPLLANWATADDEMNHRKGIIPAKRGASNDPKVVRELWKRYDDGVPAIVTQFSGLTVIDADYHPDLGEFGPDKLEALFKEHGFDASEFTFTTGTGGTHTYLKTTDAIISNSAGGLADLDCDLRSAGLGFVIAPGSWLKDGATYGDRNDAMRLATIAPNLQPVPQFVVNMINAGSPKAKTNASERVAVEKHLRETELPDGNELVDPLDGAYDLDQVKREQPRFAATLNNPRPDPSGNLQSVLNGLRVTYPDIKSEEAFAIYIAIADSDTESFGEYDEESDGRGILNSRKFSYAWIKAAGSTASRPVDGNQFDAALETEADAPAIVQKSRPVGILLPFRPSLRLPNEIAPRPFIYRHWLQRGVYSLLVAPGGRAKSLLLESIGIDLAAGVDVLRGGIERPYRVFLYNGEDSPDELDRRLGAYVETHKLPTEARHRVRENLWFQSGVLAPFKFATTKDGVVKRNNSLIEKFAEFLRDNKIDVALMDPFATLHSVEENGNNPMEEVAGIFKMIAAETNVAMMIAHHSRKTSKGEKITAADLRGATALANASRGVIAINDLTEKDHRSSHMPGRWTDYLVVGNADKNNFDRRGTSSNVTLRLDTFMADNATAEYKADTTPVLLLVQADVTEDLGEVDDDDDAMLPAFPPRTVKIDDKESRADMLVEIMRFIAGRDQPRDHAATVCFSRGQMRKELYLMRAACIGYDKKPLPPFDKQGTQFKRAIDQAISDRSIRKSGSGEPAGSFFLVAEG